MPIHDWTRLEPGDFHHFHQTWTPLIAAALNGGLLPPEFTELVEQVTGRPIPDVVTLQTRQPKSTGGGLTVQAAKPSARVVQKLERINYARHTHREVP